MSEEQTEPFTTETQFYTLEGPGAFPLRLGGSLESVTLAYESYGELNEDRSNAILLFHALSGSQHAAGYNPEVPGAGTLWTEECHTGWWDGFIGPGKALDTRKFYVLCVNYIGGCYGSTGPCSIDPQTGKPYGSTFPRLTIADIVDSQVRLLDHLGIDKLHAVTGASLGGMMSLSLATRYPERVNIVAPIGTGLQVTILQRIHNFEQILAIEQDPNFKDGDYYGGPSPDEGLSLARIIAHKTYVSLHFLEDRAREEVVEPAEGYKKYRYTHPVESYMTHQGRKFARRFDANTYLRIIEAWQRFNLTQEAGVDSLKELFTRCKDQKYMVFSIDSDVSFYPDEQEILARVLKKAGIPCRRITVHSEKGHDAFLLEPELFSPHLIASLKNRW